MLSILNVARKTTVPGSTNESLAIIDSILNRISAEPKRTIKERIIQESLSVPNFITVVKYALDPFKMYGISSLRTFKATQAPTTEFTGYKYKQRSIDNLYKKLDDLAVAAGASNYDKEELSFLAAFDKDSMKVVNRILKKDLRCGAGLRTFKKYIPELPLHEVMLCESDFEKFKTVCDNNPKNVMASIKLDGVRTWAIIDNIEKNKPLTVKYTSRNGMAYENFDCFTASVKDLACALIPSLEYSAQKPITRLIFDGEAISKSRDFDSFCGRARAKKDINTDDFVFYVFDFIAEYGTGTVFELPYSGRHDFLSTVFYDIQKVRTTPGVEYLKPTFISKWEDVPEMLEVVLQQGEEGLVLKRLDSFYKFGRSKDWCKVKNRTFAENTVDVPVVGKMEGTGLFVGSLGALIVNFNGIQVKVGSGYTVEQRDMYWKTPPKMIEVAYQGITKEGSLRFPIFIKARDDKYEPENQLA